MVRTTLELNKKILNFNFLSIIDSGADHCVFPAAYGEQIGLDIEKGLYVPAGGVGGRDDWYFHDILVWVNIEAQAWHWKCRAGFSRGMDKLGIGLLGRLGFFELFEEITFDQGNRTVKLKCQGQRPPKPNQPMK